MPSADLCPFQPRATARTADRALKLALKAMAQAKHCAVLWFADIVERKMYREFGYSSIYQYADQELGFSTSRTGDFLRLARKLETLPELKQAMATGKIGYTKAREVIKVAAPETEVQWIAEAGKSSRRDLEQKVSLARKTATAKLTANPAQGQLLKTAKPSAPAARVTHRVTFELTTEQLARYEVLWEKLQRQGAGDKANILLEAMAALLGGGSEENAGPQVQIHVHQCPDCKQAAIATSKGEKPITENEIERLNCDARIIEPGRRNRATIPPATRRMVLSRDRHRCRAPGCRSTRFLEVHHIKPRSRGGTNDQINLITLCGGCHRLLHERKMEVPSNLQPILRE